MTIGQFYQRIRMRIDNEELSLASLNCKSRSVRTAW